MSSDSRRKVLSVKGVSKTYDIWSKPSSRLYVPILRRVRGGIRNKWLSGYLDNKLSKMHRTFTALHPINLEIFEGESVGIVGRNGAGKSTLLKVITGVLRPSTGRVKRSGRVAALLELGSGFDLEATGIENIYNNGALLGLDTKQLERDLDQIVKFADIGSFIDQPMKKYSSGMKMRLAFAITTSLEPEILIVDEALAVGDDSFRRKCYSRIEELKEGGCSLLFVSHSAGNVIQLCDRAILLEAGELLLKGSPKFVIGHYQRLTNASHSNRERIANEIKVGLDESELEIDEEVTQNSKKREKRKEATFDPNFKPKSTIAFDPQGAIISNFRLEDEHKYSVNQLQRRVRYRFSYAVDFYENCRNVRFSMLIKNTEGIGIGGLVTDKPGRGFSKVLMGEEKRLNFEFTCNLAPGTYFINAGVKGMFEDREIFLHRILDAFIFRVEEEKDLVVTSFVDFDISYSIDKSYENNRS